MTIKAAIIADVAGSSDHPAFARARDQHLGQLTRQHQKPDIGLHPYTVTAWDEFQTVITHIEAVPRVIFDLRIEFAPMHLYIGVGVGTVTEHASNKPVNESMSGQAFLAARSAIDQLKRPMETDESGRKRLRLTRWETGNDQVDPTINLIYLLHDSLIRQVSEKEWQVMKAMAELNSGQQVAERLNKATSTVSRQLKSGGYWQMRDTVRVVEQYVAQQEWSA